MKMHRTQSRYLILSALATPALVLGIGTAPALATTFGSTGSATTFTVADTGFYQITVDGAAGGAGPNASGGLGAAVSGDIFLSSGTLLHIVVGGGGTGSGR